MNLFVLAADPAEAARYHHDRHVVKMTLETAQCLSTVARFIGYDGPSIYRSTHKGHPCIKWIAAGLDNMEWAAAYGKALAREYTHRFGKTHASELVLDTASDWLRNHKMYSRKATPFAQAMPDEFKQPDAVEAYRAYYRAKKVVGQRWTNRPQPEWL